MRCILLSSSWLSNLEAGEDEGTYLRAGTEGLIESRHSLTCIRQSSFIVSFVPDQSLPFVMKAHVIWILEICGLNVRTYLKILDYTRLVWGGAQNTWVGIIVHPMRDEPPMDIWKISDLGIEVGVRRFDRENFECINLMLIYLSCVQWQQLYTSQWQYAGH
jgi:hypothetical protein